MNNVVLSGRLTANPDVRYGEDGKPIAKYTLAVDKRFKREGQSADFIPCIVFGKNAEFAEKYLTKGIKIMVAGEIQTGSYKNKEGVTVYFTDIIADGIEFLERADKTATGSNESVPEGFTIDESDIPFD